MKRIVIHMAGRVEQHLRSGNTYPIDRRLERRGNRIYLERNYRRHPSIAGVRTILLPEEHLWVVFFEGHDEPHPCRCYIHMALIHDRGETILVEDLYLDLLVWQDGKWHLDDIDEFRAAVAERELTEEQMQAALLGLENACRMVERAGTNVEEFLNALVTQGDD